MMVLHYAYTRANTYLTKSNFEWVSQLVSISATQQMLRASSSLTEREIEVVSSQSNALKYQTSQ